MIAFGTGGIKPCVSAFGGDQFGPGREKQLQWFFSLFYLSINAGSLISTFVTPVFRQQIDCSERGDCFPLAFGVPAILMIVALSLFIFGRPYYRRIPPAKGNIILETFKCITVSVASSFPSLSLISSFEASSLISIFYHLHIFLLSSPLLSFLAPVSSWVIQLCFTVRSLEETLQHIHLYPGEQNSLAWLGRGCIWCK